MTELPTTTSAGKKNAFSGPILNTKEQIGLSFFPIRRSAETVHQFFGAREPETGVFGGTKVPDLAPSHR